MIKEGDYTDAEKMMHQKNKESLQDKQLKDKNALLAKRENEREMLRKKKQLMQTNSYDPTLQEAKKKNDDAVAINPKVGGSCAKCGGMLIDSECECCGKKQKVDEGMTLKDFKANRRKLKRREASADAKKRGHVGKEWYNSGRKYSPDENNYSADKTKNPKKLRKQAAMGEETILEKAPPGAKFERMVKHIKAKYKKDGLTDVEKRKAYGTAWKVYNAEESDIVNEAGDWWHPDPEKDKKLPGKGPQMRAREDRGQSKKPDYSKSLKPGETYMDFAKRKARGESVEYEIEEGMGLNELNRYEKETGKDYKTGKEVKSGGSTDKAFTMVKKMMRSQTGKPAGQRKKEPGKKPPTAGSYGAPASPAQKVAKRRANRQRSIDNMSSRFD